MGLIMHGGVGYTGGGTDVTPNPTESATEDMTKVDIDGTVYGIKDAGAVRTAQVGVASGVAGLDENGLVPSSQLPSYVDDIVEGTAQNVQQVQSGTYSASGFIKAGESSPTTLEANKVYLDTTLNIQFRWTGSDSNLVSIGSGLTLGETQYTAYRGDRGKAAYDHTQLFPIVDGKVCIVFEE